MSKKAGKIFFLLVASIFIFGCGGESKAKDENDTTLANIKAEVKTGLLDPYSAQFGEFSLIEDNRACITVNSKNLFGGYVGNQQFLLIKEDAEWSVLGVEDDSHERCVEIQVALHREQVIEDLFAEVCEMLSSVDPQWRRTCALAEHISVQDKFETLMMIQNLSSSDAE